MKSSAPRFSPYFVLHRASINNSQMVLSAAAADAVIVHVAVWTPVLTNTPTREISTVRAQAAGALQGNSAFRVRWEDPAP